MTNAADVRAEYAALDRDGDRIAAWLDRIAERGGRTLPGELAGLDAAILRYSVRLGELVRLRANRVN